LRNKLSKNNNLTTYNKLFGSQYDLTSLDLDEPSKDRSITKSNEGLQTIQGLEAKKEKEKQESLLQKKIQKEYLKNQFKKVCLDLANKRPKFEYLPFSNQYILTQLQSMYLYARTCFEDNQYKTLKNGLRKS